MPTQWGTGEAYLYCGFIRALDPFAAISRAQPRTVCPFPSAWRTGIQYAAIKGDLDNKGRNDHGSYGPAASSGSSSRASAA